MKGSLRMPKVLYTYSRITILSLLRSRAAKKTKDEEDERQKRVRKKDINKIIDFWLNKKF